MSVCLSSKTQKAVFFSTYSGSTEPIELKFTLNIHFDNRSALVNLKKIFCLFVCLFVRKNTKNLFVLTYSESTEPIELKSVFPTCSKTIKAIDLKFTHTIRVGRKSVLGNLKKSICLFVSLFVRKKTKNSVCFFFNSLQND